MPTLKKRGQPEWRREWRREVSWALALDGVPIDVLAERPNTTRGAL
jgi:hypothetical protein